MNKAARNLQFKTANIVAATDIDKADRNKLEQLINIKFGRANLKIFAESILEKERQYVINDNGAY